MAQLNLKNTYHYAPEPLSNWASTPDADNGDESTPEKPTSGRTRPSLNAVKHGGCSKTLILPHESIGDWELVLSHWCAAYRPKEDTLEFDFVLKAAQAEFRRLRADRNYDDFLASLETRPPFTWTETEIKTHDLMQRYLTAATREFQRQYHMLEHHYRTHKPMPAEPIEGETVEENTTGDPTRHGIHAVGGKGVKKAASAANPAPPAQVPPDCIIFTNSKGERIG